jgi:pimeloyl-ACP methyl ester carboxylesterase
MKLKAGELSFHVLETGSGEPALLFLHYYGGSARTWNAVTSQLSTNLRCIAYDQRGWGQSDAPEQGYSIRDLQTVAFLTAHPTSDTLREQILADNFAASSQAKLAWPTLSAYEDISAAVGNIAVPTLILAGDQDRQDPLEQHRREVLPRIPAANIEVIRDCGHLIPIDQPYQLAEAIRAFVSSLDQGR